MTTSQTYTLSPATVAVFDRYKNDQSWHSELYAMDEFLEINHIHGYVIRMKRLTCGSIQVKMCVDVLNKKTNRFYIDKLNHELND